MGKSYLSYTMALILQALDHGYRYGFDIMTITGLASGTVYPALRRLEDAQRLDCWPICHWRRCVPDLVVSRPDIRERQLLRRPGQGPYNMDPAIEPGAHGL